MRELRIHFTIDQQAKQEIVREVNYYLDIAHFKGICLNIDKFEFEAAEIFDHKDDKNLGYTVKAKLEGQYDDSIYVFFKDGQLDKINFCTWYYELKNDMVTFEGGQKPFETGREMTVTKKGYKALMYKMSSVEEIIRKSKKKNMLRVRDDGEEMRKLISFPFFYCNNIFGKV